MTRNMALMAALVALALAQPAAAQGTGAARCTLAATPLAFGSYSPTSGAPTDFTATLTVTCTGSGTESAPVEGTITLPGGASGRRLVSGDRSLRYQLYVDPARSIPWSDGVGGGRTASVSGVVSPNTVFRQSITIYGRILARQSDAAVGAYADQIEAILTY